MSRFTRLLVIALLLYVGGYVVFRQTHIEVWDRDKQAYVIFPESYGRPLYYAWAAAGLSRRRLDRHAASYRAASVRPVERNAARFESSLGTRRHLSYSAGTRGAGGHRES